MSAQGGTDWRGRVTVWAGCFDCWGTEAHWYSANGQGLAVQHARRYNHSTWVDITRTFRYNDPDAAPPVRTRH